MEIFINFAKGLLTNRLGIVLAMLNLCYLMSQSHSLGFCPLNGFDKIILAQNLPAGAAALITAKFASLIFHATEWLSFPNLWTPLFLFFITLQWLFICWSAKMIARKIRQR
jgi:hypothetical protein